MPWNKKIEKIPAFLSGLGMLINPRRWGPFTEAASLSKFDHSFTISWSQGGEDLALMALLPEKNGVYIDIGAHHPSRFSVTRHLYQRGWRGVNVEPNPRAEELFRSMRPEDTFLNACVGNLDSYEFYIFEETALSTNNQEWKSRYLAENHKIKTSIKVMGMSLQKVIEIHLAKRPDVLIIDTEGSDFEVIQSGNWHLLSPHLWPTYIVCETTPPLERTLDMESVKFLQNIGYEIQCVLPMSTILKLSSNAVD